MITIKNFGWRLGNQMFQIAAMAQAAAESDDEFVIPSAFKDRLPFFKFPFQLSDEIPLSAVHKENGFHYQEIPVSTDNLALEGYFQSWKYCDPRRLRELFRFSELNIWVRPSVENTCSVHVRRGDYLNYPEHHPICSSEYFLQAIDLVKKRHGARILFMVFSDDIEWCQRNLKPEDTNIYYVSGNTDIQDLCTMSRCKHNIIANSTFSLMAAMLNDNPDKMVISPSKNNWHGPAYAHWNHDDLIPEEFIQIEF